MVVEIFEVVVGGLTFRSFHVLVLPSIKTPH